jgi:hypothetical protein
VNKFSGKNHLLHCTIFVPHAIGWRMKVMLKTIVVSYNPRTESFHRESLREYVQGNALRLLKNHPVVSHAIAIVDTPQEADKAVALFTRMRSVAQGLAEPELASR